MKELVPLGIILIFIGLIIVFIGALSSMKTGDTKVAVGGFVGFIPFGFANDKRMLYFVISLTAFIFFMWVLFYLVR